MSSFKSPLTTPMAHVLDLAPSVIKANPTWEDMWDAFAEVMAANVESPIRQLERIRYILSDTDEQVVKDTARLLGFDLSQDVLNLNADNFTRIVTQLPMYPDQNGTELFIKFIDLALNAVTSVEYLYTNDYVNFHEQPGGDFVFNGGTWFKTTHVNLEIAIRNVNTLALAPGQSLLDRTIELFYMFAPATLVIKEFVFVVETDPVSFGIGAALGDAEITITI